jgi:hypothetical protein
MNFKGYLLRNRKVLISAAAVIIIIRIFSSNGYWVESGYSSGFYSLFSAILRFLFGWIPFSLGDIIYLVAGCWLFWKLLKNTGLLFRGKLSWRILLKKISYLIAGFVFIYIIFNLFWGINYNRKGIAYQLDLAQLHYDTTDLKVLQDLLLQKVNSSKISLLRQGKGYPSNNELFRRAENCYTEVSKKYSFLRYKNPSVKSSLYGWFGNYLGFTGYYNPFTGEAQVNTGVPRFLIPFIATHEMAHQLGYAKENEANFVGYLAGINSSDTLFHYSVYFDLFVYANREVFYFDSTYSRNALQQLDPGVISDLRELAQFDRNHRSFLEPAITWMYGNYLKMNQQPQGIRSYNAVIGMLIAYYKKYGSI